MKIHLLPSLMLLLLSLCGTVSAADDEGSSLLRDGHPDEYTVQEGDTLWGIADMFLVDAWMWPEIWRVNPEIENPHLIYPGDQIVLKYVGGEPTLTLRRGDAGRTYKMKPNQTVRQGDRYEKVEPRVRIEPLTSAIPAIPLDAIASLMNSGRIVEEGFLDDAPYIIGGRTDRLVFGAGDRVYVRGDWDDSTSTYGIYRKGNTYIDPDTGELLGHEALEVGTAKALDREGDIVTFRLTGVNQDIRLGDRLLPTEERRVDSTFYPSAPESQVDGLIMTVLGGVTQVGRNDVVVINRGENAGLEAGHVLAIDKRGARVKDRFTNDYVQLPSERAGLLMVFRTFEKLSYALVLRASEPLRIDDIVTNP